METKVNDLTKVFVFGEKADSFDRKSLSDVVIQLGSLTSNLNLKYLLEGNATEEEINKKALILIQQGKLNTLPDYIVSEKLDSITEENSEKNNGVKRITGSDVFIIPDSNNLEDKKELIRIAEKIKIAEYKEKSIDVYFFIHGSTVGNIYNDFGFVEIQKLDETNCCGVYAKTFSHTSDFFETKVLKMLKSDVNGVLAMSATKELNNYVDGISINAKEGNSNINKTYCQAWLRESICISRKPYIADITILSAVTQLQELFTTEIDEAFHKHQIIVWYHSPAELNQLYEELKTPGKFTLNFEEIYKGDVKKKGVRRFVSRDYLPIIHVFDDDIMSEDGREKGYFIPRFKKFFDSSIWHYYLPVKKSDIGEDDESLKGRFNVICKNIVSNYKNGLYDLQISHEFIDLQNRLLGESWLPSTDAHGKDVSPYLFHSESEMKKKIEIEKLSEKAKPYKWRILLIDDFADAELKKMDGNSSNISKATILHKLFEQYKFNTGEIKVKQLEGEQVKLELESDIIKDCNIAICKATDLNTAEQLLKAYSFDIILIDYLLGIREGGVGRHYGYELLETLKKGNENDYKVGSCGKYFIMFISAFTTAINDRLLSEGITHNDTLWLIGEGACPINTPSRFMYYLLHLMNTKIRRITSQNRGWVKNKDGESILTVIDLLKTIYPEEDNGKNTIIRDEARIRFNEVLDMRYRYKMLENDILSDDMKKTADELWLEKSSVFVKSAFHFIHLFSGAFFEHLQHLVYLTAFGTIRQWEELWEEYVFVHNELEEYDRLMSNQGKECKDGQHISDAIRSYIIRIKENAY